MDEVWLHHRYVEVTYTGPALRRFSLELSADAGVITQGVSKTRYLWKWPYYATVQKQSGSEIYGRPVVRDDQNLTLTTKLQNMVAHWTTIIQAPSLLKI